MQEKNHFPEPNWHMSGFIVDFYVQGHIPSTSGDALTSEFG
jgi:hypothetical protein